MFPLGMAIQDLAIFTMLGVFVVLPSFTLSRSYYIVMVYSRLFCSVVLLLWDAVLSLFFVLPWSRSASLLWTDTAVGAGGGSRTGLCGFVAAHLVCPIACRFMEDSISVETGRSALRLQRSFEFAFQTSRCQRCLERRASRLPAVVDSLAALAFDEASLKTASGGRLASSAGV